MPPPLLETKFYVPRPRRGLVPRPRLSERLDRGAASTLMLVCGDHPRFILFHVVYRSSASGLHPARVCWSWAANFPVRSIAWPRCALSTRSRTSVPGRPPSTGSRRRCEQSGVRGHRILRPVDDARYVLIDLDFQTTGEAEKFLGFLQTTVWAAPQNAPALAGTPQARILEPADADTAQQDT